MPLRENDRSREAIAERIQLLALALGLTQSEMADQASIPRNRFNQWWKGHERPGIDGAMAFCDTFGVTLDFFYNGKLAGMSYDTVQKMMEKERA